VCSSCSQRHCRQAYKGPHPLSNDLSSFCPGMRAISREKSTAAGNICTRIVCKLRTVPQRLVFFLHGGRNQRQWVRFVPELFRCCVSAKAPPGRGLLNSRHRQAYQEREFFIDHLLVRIHFIIVMIRWTGLAPWEFEFPFPRSHSPLRCRANMAHIRQSRPDSGLGCLMPVSSSLLRFPFTPCWTHSPPSYRGT